MATVARPATILPDSGSDLEAEPIRDYINNILTMLEGNNFDDANVDFSSSDGIMALRKAQTVTGAKTHTANIIMSGSGIIDLNGLANALVLDADADTHISAPTDDQIDIAIAGNDTVILAAIDDIVKIQPAATSHTAATNVTLLNVASAGAQTIPAGTTTYVTGATFNEPNITATGTVTNAATVRIVDAPTEASNNYALWVDSGASKFDGTTNLVGVTTHGGNVVSDTDSTDDLGTTGVRWANLWVDAIVATDTIAATSYTGALLTAVTAVTQSDSNNSTKVATTAYVDSMVGGVTGVTLSGSTPNTIATVTGANALAGEANLTFDGTTLGVIGATDGAMRVGADANNYVQFAWDTSAARMNFTGKVAGGAHNGFYINEDTGNGNMSTGVTINQGADDNEILALKSSDVAHGVTGNAETDTYGTFSKYTAAGGGLLIVGYSAAAGPAGSALHLKAILGEAADTTKSTSARAVAYVSTLVKDGTSTNFVGADGNLFAIGNSETTRFIFDAEGSGHADVEWTTYDTYNDLATISEMETVLLANELPEQTPRRHAMEATGIIGKGSWHMENGKPRAMVNFSKLAMLHHGALIQVGDRFAALEDRLEQSEAKLLVAETKLNRLEN